MKLINGLYELTPEEVKLLEKKDDTWPKNGDAVWLVDWDADWFTQKFNNDNSFHKGSLSIGNIFRTKEECQAHVEYLKAVQIIKKDAKGFVPDWSDDSQNKYFGYYSGRDKCLTPDIETDSVYSGIYFATQQDIKDSFKNNRQAWLTYLGVKK